MTPELLFTKIEILLPILREFQSKGTAQMDVEKKMLLQEVYLQVLQVTIMNLAFSTCVVHYMTVMASYHSREFPKWLAT